MSDTGRILIADDDETFLLSTADLLRKEGYDCDCAQDAATAAEMLCKDEYELIIADIRMPGNDELQFIRELPSIIEGVSVILVTGYPSVSTAIEAVKLPVVAYLVKPIDWVELLTHTQIAISGYRTYRTVDDAQVRLKDWSEKLEALSDNVKQKAGESGQFPMESFFSLTAKNIVGSLADLYVIMASIGGKNIEPYPCHLLNCPRIEGLTEAIVETIEILEKTKSSFKSKQLSELRKKLENVLKEIEK